MPLSMKSKELMDKATSDAKGEPVTPASEKVELTPEVEAPPAWAQALIDQVTALKAELDTSKEVQKGMTEVMANQELQLQEFQGQQVPVAPTTVMHGLPPSVSETPNGNVRHDL